MDARQLAAQPDLDFTPREPVRWLAPAQLARTAAKAGLSGAFAAYLDKRETQAGFGADVVDVPPDADGGLWLDYAADTGDGFDATMTVAWLLAQPHLPGGDGDQPGELPRGSLLVLGGDEVYPTPTVGDYDDRLKGPLRSALPDPGPAPTIDVRAPQTAAQTAAQSQPTMLAVPGNHDWYDGLTAFVRTFTQRRRIGGWQTVQQRSYFAARLPQCWWLVGLDTQLGAELDDPQVTFFREQLTPRMQPGDGVIVCAPTPTWVRVGQGRHRAFDQLRWFERQVVEPAGAQVRLWLSGDDHHYAHYVEAGPDTDGEDGDGQPVAVPRHAVTCGLGGAYLATTADLPDTLDVPGPGSRMQEDPTHYVRTAEWPDVATARRLHRGCVTSPTRTIPLRNPGFWTLVGGLHVLAFLVLSVVLAFGLRRSPAVAVRDAGLHHVGHLSLQAATWCAWLLGVGAVTTLLRRAGFVWVGPALAAIAQLALALGSLAAICALPWPAHTPPWLVYLAALVATGAVTGFVASLLIGVSLLVIGRFGGQTPLGAGAREAVMSSQAIEDFKGLLRIRLRPDGVLVVHPLGVRQVCRQWDVVRPATAGRAPTRVVPAQGHEPRPTPIEAPFEVRRG